MANEEPGRVEKITQDLAAYVNMRVDAAKLSLIEALATIFGSGLVILISIILGSIALVLMTAACALWLGELMGSLVGALLVMGGAYLLLAVLVYALRNKLLINGMVGFLSRLLFRPKEKIEDDEHSEE